jgi:hypothetical protein
MSATLLSNPLETRAHYMATEETFGSIISRLTGDKIPLAKIAKEADISYPHFHTLVTGVRSGKAIYPSVDIIEKVVLALGRIGVHVGPLDRAALMQTAAQLPEGYFVVTAVPDIEPPENFEDWPQELKEAMHYSKELSPAVQRHIYQLWAEQARAHMEIEYARRRALLELQEIQNSRHP